MSKVREKPLNPSPWDQVFSPEEVYTLEEVAEKVKATPRQVRRWTDDGRLKFLPLPKGRRILGQWMIDFLSARTEER